MIIFATGPKVADLTRDAALAAAKSNPNFPKNADEITVEELDGHWVAAVHVADNPFGGPADQTDDGAGPKSEGPDDTKPEPKDDKPDDGGEGPDMGEGPDGPPKPEDGKKGGEGHELHALMDAVQKILVALGIPDTEGESPVPGEEPPGGPEGPPPGPPGAEPQTVHHEKALKPGEVPPGQTPVGAPAFSSVNPIVARGETHPWENLVARDKHGNVVRDKDGNLKLTVATQELEERVPDHYGASDVDAELREVAYATPFKVKQTQVLTDPKTGHRIARALISAY